MTHESRAAEGWRAVRLSPTARAPAEARDVVDRIEVDLAPEEKDAVRLLVSELVTNSVRHAGLGPDDRIELGIAVTPKVVRVTVTDPGGGFEPPSRSPRPGHPSGWGLFLVQRLADRWGVSSDGRTGVWLELHRDN
jgi:anti-sigma regulatory factor (Ser/Thr protein kinase)